MTGRSRSIWLLGSLILVSAGAGCSGSVERAAVGGCTMADGRQVGVGESVPAGDGCNTCSCTESGLACTEVGCGGGGGAGKDAGAGCEHDGYRYAPGDSFPAGDGCNTCTCHADGSASCTFVYCPKGCVYGGREYAVGEGFMAEDGCNKCTCEAPGVIACTAMDCSSGCIYGGIYFGEGDSFPSLDGCNTCTCLAGGRVGCTTMACMCNPAAEWHRHYVADSPAQCALIDYECPENTAYFGNDCGCGCEQNPSCPRTFDCMPPSPCDPEQIKRECPYSMIAL